MTAIRPERSIHLQYLEGVGPGEEERVERVVDPDGNKVPEDAVVEHVRFARLTRVSIEGNADFCRGVLSARYGMQEEKKEATL